MKMPPYLVAMRIVSEGRTKLRLWFPLFLLWPVALPFVALTLLGTAIVDGFRFLAGRKGAYTRLAIGVLGIVGETRGTEVFSSRTPHTPWPSGYARKESIMTQERDRILDLLAAGKITAEEAARLLDAVDPRAGQTADATAPAAAKTAMTPPPKFMYVKVLSVKGDNVNVKIPLALVRAGLKLTSLIPPQAMDQIDRSLAEKGMSFDLKNLKPEDLEDIIESLREMEINVDSADGDNVRVYAA